MTDPNRTSEVCMWCDQTLAQHRDSGPMAKMPCGGLKRGFIAEIGSKLFSQTSVGDVPAPKFLDDKEFMGRVSARMTQAGYSECDAMRIVHADMQNDAVKLERAAVVKYLRTMAESTTFTTRAQSALRLAAEEIEGGMHQP